MNKSLQNTLSVLVGASVAAGVGTGAVSAAYSDTAGHWGAGAIDRWSQYGVVSGYENGAFRPDGSMTRAEVATVLANLLNLSRKADISRFADVDADAWYADAIAKCVAAGILNGIGEGTMAPEAMVSRQQMFVMFARAVGLEPVSGAARSFTDSGEIAPWAAGYINALAERGVLSGVGGGRLAPLSLISRASAMAVLDKAIGAYAGESGAAVSLDGGDGRMALVVAEDVTVTGQVDRLVVAGQGSTVAVSGGKVGEVAVLSENSSLSLSGQSQVGSIHIHPGAAGAAVKVEKDAEVETVKSAADHVSVSGEGRVDSAVITGNHNAIDTGGTKVEAAEGTTGNTAGGQPVQGGGGETEEQEKALLTTSIGQQVFPVGVPTEFTVTTAARDDAGELVRGFFTLSDGEAIEKLEYLEPRDGQWYELKGAFGPEGGFPVADATSRFRVTFRKAGSFDLRIELRRVADDAVVCAAEEKAEAVALSEDTAAVGSQEAFLAAVAAGKDVLLTNSFTADALLTVDQAVAVDGNGFAITSANGAVGGAGGGILVTAPAVLRDLKVAGPNASAQGWDSGQYGIKLYGAEGVTLENITVEGANAGILVSSASAALKGTITLTGNEFGGIEVSKGSQLDKAGSLDITGAVLVNSSESLERPTLWIDGNAAGGAVTGGDHLFAIAAGDSKTHYYLNNFVGEAIAAAGDYAYDDGYVYRGTFRLESEGKSIAVSADYTAAAAAEDEGKAVMHDLARFLGALHRQDGGRTIRRIVFDGVAYTWNQEGTLLGSNWEHEGATLVSAIVKKALGGETAFQLAVEDLTVTFRYSVSA